MAHPAPPIDTLGYPELQGTDPARIVDVKIPAPPNRPYTQSERAADREKLRVATDDLATANRQRNAVNFTSKTLMPNQLAGERAAAAEPGGGGRQASVDALTFARTFRQRAAKTDAKIDVARAQASIEDVLRGGDIDDLTDPLRDTLRIFTENETTAEAALTAAESGAQSAQRACADRRASWETRRAYERAHPGATAEQRALNELRVQVLGREALAAATAAERNLENERKAAAAAAGGENLATLYSATIGNILAGHRLHVRRAQHLGEQVTLRVDMWQIGELPAEPRELSDITHLQEAQAKSVKELSPHATSRAELTTNMVIDRYRTAERQLQNPGYTPGPEDPQYMADGGILVRRGAKNPQKSVILYDDGSQARYNSSLGGWDRRWSNGEAWTRPAALDDPEPPLLVLYRTAPSPELAPTTAELREWYYNVAQPAWEEARGPEYAHEALGASTALSGRLSEHLAVIDTAITVIDDRERTVRGNVADLQATIARLERDYPEPDRRPDAVKAQLSVHRNSVRMAKSELAGIPAKRQAEQVKKLPIFSEQNKVEFWKARHIVTDQQGTVPTPGQARLYGKDVEVNTTINGKSGRWRISIDGSSSLLDPSGHVAEEYYPNGVKK